MPEMVLEKDRKTAVERLCNADCIWSDVASPWGNHISFTLPSSFQGRSIQMLFFPVKENDVSCTGAVAVNGDEMDNALVELPVKYDKGNWNGFGERPLDRRSYDFAIEFARRLPQRFRKADIGIDADGEVTFEWYRAKDNQCSLTFAASGTIYCIVRNGGDRITATISSKAVGKILDLISEVVRG